ncbi:hypothetical protein [Arthrobacter agilis]|uniref:hypothetical protein n=1 Tax=Arthrobacter agilis TaxID=37921 RepID=UPI00278293E0|nr:hypothetical protein [Arthrobacter agilis]MDQ0734527.1 hypothetical protein [Arthrobacter agilis]
MGASGAGTAGTRPRYAVLGGAVLAVMLTGCEPFAGQACPAIGWVNAVEIRLDGSADDVERVAWVELCDDLGCSTPAAPPAPPDDSPPPPPSLPASSARPAPALLTPPALPTAAPAPPHQPEEPYYWAEPDGEGRWRVQVGMSTPDTVTIRAFAADSAVLAEATVDLAWERVGGSAACGGPMATGTLGLAIRG